MEKVKTTMSLEDVEYELQKVGNIEKNFTYFNRKQKEDYEIFLKKQETDREKLALKIINKIYEDGYMEDGGIYVEINVPSSYISDRVANLVCDKLVKQGWPQMYLLSAEKKAGGSITLLTFVCGIIAAGPKLPYGAPVEPVD
jgi:hypothetical protein